MWFTIALVKGFTNGVGATTRALRLHQTLGWRVRIPGTINEVINQPPPRLGHGVSTDEPGLPAAIEGDVSNDRRTISLNWVRSPGPRKPSSGAGSQRESTCVADSQSIREPVGSRRSPPRQPPIDGNCGLDWDDAHRWAEPAPVYGTLLGYRCGDDRGPGPIGLKSPVQRLEWSHFRSRDQGGEAGASFFMLLRDHVADAVCLGD